MARRKERQQNWESSYRTRKHRSCEATTTALIDEPKESCTGTRRTETCVAPRHACRCVTRCPYYGNLLFLLILLHAPRVLFLFYFPRTNSLGGGAALPDFFSFYFPCSVDHERDWPPREVGFRGWQPVR